MNAQKRIEKFEMKKGFMLFVQIQGGSYLLSWDHVDDLGTRKYWPGSLDKKIVMPFSNFDRLLEFLLLISEMFMGPIPTFKDRTHEFPAYLLAIELK